MCVRCQLWVRNVIPTLKFDYVGVRTGAARDINIFHGVGHMRGFSAMLRGAGAIVGAGRIRVFCVTLRHGVVGWDCGCGARHKLFCTALYIMQPVASISSLHHREPHFSCIKWSSSRCASIGEA